MKKKTFGGNKMEKKLENLIRNYAIKEIQEEYKVSDEMALAAITEAITNLMPGIIIDSKWLIENDRVEEGFNNI